MVEFEVAGQAYRSGKIAARTQFHVIRRLAPMTDAMFGLMGADGVNPERVSAFARAIGELDDAAVDYVLDQCLAVVERRQGQGWAKIMASDGKTLMFQDVDMVVQIDILRHVLIDNYTALFQKALATWKGGGSPSTSIG